MKRSKPKPRKSPPAVKRIAKRIRERQQLDKVLEALAKELMIAVNLENLTHRWP